AEDQVASGCARKSVVAFRAAASRVEVHVRAVGRAEGAGRAGVADCRWALRPHARTTARHKAGIVADRRAVIAVSGKETRRVSCAGSVADDALGAIASELPKA